MLIKIIYVRNSEGRLRREVLAKKLFAESRSTSFAILFAGNGRNDILDPSLGSGNLSVGVKYRSVEVVQPRRRVIGRQWRYEQPRRIYSGRIRRGSRRVRLGSEPHR